MTVLKNVSRLWNDSPPDLAYWDQMAQTNSETAVLDPRDRRGHKTKFIHLTHLRALEVELDALPRAEAALDFGCGRGRLAPLLVRHARRVVGVDTGAVLLAAARREQQLPGVSFVQYDGSTLPFAADEFDLCLTVGVLQYMAGNAQHRARLAELSRVIRPGGRLLSLEQTGAHSANWRPSLDGYARALGEHGLELVRSRPVRNGRDTLTYAVAFGLVPGQWLPRAAALEGQLARRRVWPWNVYREHLMLFEKRR